MRMQCPTCNVYFHLDAKPSVNFATGVGAVVGAVLARRMRGVALGGLIGYGMAKIMHKGTECPRCAEIKDTPVKDVTPEPAEA